MDIKKHIETLHRINNQRKGWLILSATVMVVIAGIILDWTILHSTNIIWLSVSLGLFVSVIWWYWTMRLIQHLITFKIIESKILDELIQEIRYIKTEVKNVFDPVDKDK
jgi:hypothetical protein